MQDFTWDELENAALGERASPDEEPNLIPEEYAKLVMSQGRCGGKTAELFRQQICGEWPETTPPEPQVGEEWWAEIPLGEKRDSFIPHYVKITGLLEDNNSFRYQAKDEPFMHCNFRRSDLTHRKPVENEEGKDIPFVGQKRKCTGPICVDCDGICTVTELGDPGWYEATCGDGTKGLDFEPGEALPIESFETHSTPKFKSKFKKGDKVQWDGVSPSRINKKPSTAIIEDIAQDSSGGETVYGIRLPNNNYFGIRESCLSPISGTPKVGERWWSTGIFTTGTIIHKPGWVEITKDAKDATPYYCKYEDGKCVWHRVESLTRTKPE